MSDFLTLLILLVFSGLFSGSETALTALSLARVNGLYKENRRGAQALMRLKSKPTQMLITLLIGNNLVNIAASAIATVIAVERLGDLGPSVAVGALTLIILMFGEVTPKSLALRYAERISLAVAPLILGFRWLVFPVVWLLEHFTTWIHRYMGLRNDPIVTESELISLLEHGAEEGAIEREERAIIERVFEFGDLKVKDVMTHRQQIFALEGSRSIQDVLPEILEESYSRVPIFQDHPDDIRRIVYLRDVLQAIANDNLDVPLNQISREVLFVPENQPIDELFSILGREKRHMAIVVDEYGGLQGLVTLEDLLEELVGEIYDETDEMPLEMKVLSETQIAVSGTVELRVVEDFFHMQLPGKPTDTVSLWILTRTERIPDIGEHLTIDGLDIKVEKASHRRIHQVILSQAQSTLSDQDIASAR
jgi:CBS domain containing-hemolysin-like protein